MRLRVRTVSIASGIVLSLVLLVALFLSPAVDNDETSWERYHNYTETVTKLLALNKTYSKVVDVFSIGKSLLGRDIYCIRLTNETDEMPKPEVFFVGYHHGCEWISFELPFYFVVYAATNFDSDESVTDLLNKSEIYVVVALNVDRLNSLASERERNNVKYRYNARGVDLNRNYDYKWSPQEHKSGAEPFSEPETQAIRDFVLKHHFVYAISFHSGIELILYPWSHTKDSPPEEAKFIEISQGLSGVTGETPYRQSSGLYIAYGVWGGWMYGVAGVFALTCEIYAQIPLPTSYTKINPMRMTINDPQARELLYLEEVVPTFMRARARLEYNPSTTTIEDVASRWLPAFFYMAQKAIDVHA